MTQTQQEILKAISDNAGNRLTTELIAGLNARINQAFSKAQQDNTKEVEDK